MEFWDAFYLVSFALSGLSLIISFVLFFVFKIPTLIRDQKGSLEQKQIEEIRSKNSSASGQRVKINVFEELEKKAKVKRNNTHSLNIGPTTAPKMNLAVNSSPGTTVLTNTSKQINSEFIIEKNIMFVSTDEVI